MYQNEKHKQRVENRGDGYIYIGSYHCGEITIDGKCYKKGSMIRIKCPYCGKEYDLGLDGFINQNNRCKHCCNSYINSFAYHIEVELGENLNDYWDWKKNNELGINPYYITKQCNRKVWIKCTEKDYHDSYDVRLNDFVSHKHRCPYCNHRRIHPLDSFGYLYPSKAKYWSKNNEKSPYEIAPKSGDKYKFICENCGKEFDRNLRDLNRYNTGVYCTDCNNSELEETTKQVLQKYNIKYEREKEFEKLIGEGNKPLRYDFYLPDCNLLIELQGIQHEEWQKTWMSKERFERQLEHDKRKREYAKQHNIKLLEIWYYDMDNIEDILIKELNLKKLYQYRN